MPKSYIITLAIIVLILLVHAQNAILNIRKEIGLL